MGRVYNSGLLDIRSTCEGEEALERYWRKQVLRDGWLLTRQRHHSTVAAVAHPGGA